MIADRPEYDWSDQIARVLHNVLAQARAGTLEVDWRTARPAALLAARRDAVAAQNAPPPPHDPKDPLDPLRSLRELIDPIVSAETKLLLLREVTDEVSVWDWEPARAPHVGTASALSAWYVTSAALLDEDERRDTDSAARARATTLTRPIDIKYLIQTVHLEAHSRLYFQRRRDRLAESFEALVCSSVNERVDWVANARARVMRWPDDYDRAAHLQRLKDPVYQADQERLPDYWRGC